MSKVYSFRLNNENPRESQAREVIEAWVEEGYSLRNKIVELLLLSNVRHNVDRDFMNEIIKLEKCIMSIKLDQKMDMPDLTLSKTFLDGIGQSVKKD